MTRSGKVLRTAGTATAGLGLLALIWAGVNTPAFAGTSGSNDNALICVLGICLGGSGGSGGSGTTSPSPSAPATSPAGTSGPGLTAPSAPSASASNASSGPNLQALADAASTTPNAAAPKELPSTSAPTVPVAGTGLALAAGGGVLLVVSRRRRVSA
jgi:hypothetical protein